MHRALESRAFIAAILAMTGGAFLCSTPTPFPDQQIFLRVIAERAPQAFLSFKYIYYALLFTTPYLVCSTVLSGVFTSLPSKHAAPSRRERLPEYPNPEHENRAVSRRGRSAQPAQAGAGESTTWLTSSRARSIYRNRHLGRDWKRQDFVLHAPFCGTDPFVQGCRQRKEDRRTCFWR